MNRWTSYGSPNPTDWLEIDFGAEKQFNRVDLHIYDDRGGVQPPQSYTVEYWSGAQWNIADAQIKTPATPAGSALNTVRFTTVSASKVRVVFTHKGQAKSGVTEIMVWKD